MQIPYNNNGNSQGPYGQGPPSPYQQGHSPYQGQSPYNSPPPPQYGHSYGQPPPSNHYQPYSPPPQQTYAGPQDPPRQSHSPSYYQQGPPHQQYGQPPAPQGGAAADYLGQFQQHHQQQQQHDPAPGLGAGNGEDERGFMGALAGGAAGAWAGHKVNHGFLGALGGAFAGHKLQDAVHDHNEHKKDEKKQQQQQQQQQQQHHHHHHQQEKRYEGNFSSSSSQISLDKDYDLIASCARVGGSHQLSSISLNRCLTNDNGNFRWAREGNFGASARNVRLIEGGRMLEAELAKCDGHWIWDRIALDEKIKNENGNLVMI